MEQIVPIFRERYPSIKLDLVSDGKLSDITQDGFDAGIRLGESLLKDMIAIPLGPEVRFIVVASPQYLNQYTAQ
ncbi:LysR substrate-binding domain-containing protein [Vibrio gazogenes]|uniref:LysR substrate-binding domain-containing protein n=1 Tax=Vibrio gazogenes TaxID=687 RepID=A0A1Z2SH18_VIBGA|nr:hypothetical protein BSQ33_12710 [Vibrio gazogenes]